MKLKLGAVIILMLLCVPSFAAMSAKGKVVDENGKPMAGVTVEVRFFKETTTDANGEFTLEGLPDSEVDLSAHLGNSYAFAQVDKDTGPITMKLKKMR